jgi:hypothetical protein
MSLEEYRKVAQPEGGLFWGERIERGMIGNVE